MFVIREADVRDCEIISQTLRESDREEVWCWSGQSPDTAVLTSFMVSADYRRTITWEGKPAGMFGVGTSEDVPHLGVPWFLASNSFNQWTRPFLRATRGVVLDFLRVRPVLMNFTMSTHTDTHKWLEWGGFTVDRETVRNGEITGTFYLFGAVRPGYSLP